MQSRVVLLIALFLGVAFATESQIQSGVCNLETTAAYRSHAAGGFINFNLGTGVINVDYRLYGLAPGSYKMYVYQYGDILADDGSTMGSIFNGNVGRLNNDGTVTVDANGFSVSAFSDSRIALNGANSIIGRGLGISNSAGVVQLVCVIGRQDTAATEKLQPQVAERGLIRRATCLIQPTTAGGGKARGWVDFEVGPTGSLVVEYYIPNTPGSTSAHGSHVHVSGNISDTVAALMVGGHYNNTEMYFSGRPGSLNEVGAIGNPSAYQFVPDFWGDTATQFTDPWVKLNGPNSIIGRSIVLHGYGASTSTRIGQCVIGIKSDGEGAAPIPAPAGQGNYNQTTRAAVRMVGTTLSLEADVSNWNAYVTFETQPDKTVRVRYYLYGLAPGSYKWYITESGNQGAQYDAYNDGQAPGGVLEGYGVTRANGSPNKLGYLGDNAPIVFNSDYIARGEFIDTQLRLNGRNSIIGRSLVVEDDTGARLFEGTIGIRLQSWNSNDEEPLVVTNATCHVVFGNNDASQTLNGFITFVQIDENNLLVNYSFEGLAHLANYPWHVHNWGDLLASDTIASVSGHFIGLNPVRPVGQPQEIGLINGGMPLATDNAGYAIGSLIDTQMKLYGVNSIVGRAVVIHAPSPNQATRIGYGVIGATHTLPAGAAMITPSCLLVFALLALVKLFA